MNYGRPLSQGCAFDLPTQFVVEMQDLMAPENPAPSAPKTYVVVDRLKLASWLYVNHQRLVQRELDPLRQRIAYYFEASADIESLVEQWVQKTGLVDLTTLARFSEAVSFEIRIAARLRRGEDAATLRAPRSLKGPASAVRPS